jgi:hypothetical protein
MRLIASPHLNEDDVVDIERGYDVRAVLERATMRELDQDQPETVLDGLGDILAGSSLRASPSCAHGSCWRKPDPSASTWLT